MRFMRIYFALICESSDFVIYLIIDFAQIFIRHLARFEHLIESKALYDNAVEIWLFLAPIMQSADINAQIPRHITLTYLCHLRVLNENFWVLCCNFNNKQSIEIFNDFYKISLIFRFLWCNVIKFCDKILKNKVMFY